MIEHECATHISRRTFRERRHRDEQSRLHFDEPEQVGTEVVESEPVRIEDGEDASKRFLVRTNIPRTLTYGAHCSTVTDLEGGVFFALFPEELCSARTDFL
jgi:hypothetical protein